MKLSEINFQIKILYEELSNRLHDLHGNKLRNFTAKERKSMAAGITLIDKELGELTSRKQHIEDMIDNTPS